LKEGGEFDPKKIKQGGAHYFTEDPKFANNFAAGAWNEELMDYEAKGANVLPVHLGVKKTFDYENPEHLYLLDEKFPGLLGKFDDGKDKLPSYALAQGYWKDLEKPHVMEALKSLGFDSFHVNEAGVKNTAVFDPSLIRSKFAKFDPKEKDSGKLSAAIAGTTLGAGALAGSSEEAKADTPSTYSPLLEALRREKKRP
jgi:hypothetical protein